MTRTFLVAAILLASMAGNVQAFEFSSGEWSGNLDTTVSYGASWRIKDYDPSMVGKQANNPLVFQLNKASQRNVIAPWWANGDDANLNYPEGGDLEVALIRISKSD